MPRFDPQLGADLAALVGNHRSQPGVSSTEHLASLERCALSSHRTITIFTHPVNLTRSPRSMMRFGDGCRKLGRPRSRVLLGPTLAGYSTAQGPARGQNPKQGWPH